MNYEFICEYYFLMVLHLHIYLIKDKHQINIYKANYKIPCSVTSYYVIHGTFNFIYSEITFCYLFLVLHIGNMSVS